MRIGDIRRWDAAELDALFDDLKRNEDRLVQVDDELSASGKPPEWHGQAADAAHGRHKKLGERLRELVLEFAAVRRMADITAGEVRQIRQLLTEADELASRYRFRIHDDGKIEDLGPAPGPAANDAAEVEEYRQNTVHPDLTDRVREIVRRADDADAELAKVLQQADRNLMETGAAKTLAEAAALGEQRGLAESIEPPKGSPADNARWWNSLPAETRAAMAAAPPSWLGNMDGIPAEVRHTANVNRIDDMRFSLQAQASQLRQVMREELSRPSGSSRAQSLTSKYEQVQAKLNALSDVEKVVRPGDPNSNRQLLLLDSSGERMKAAVAVGNVDTADHVAVFTPGMNTTVEGDGGLQGYDQRMQDLRQEAQRLSTSEGSGDVAAVTWIGYEAPQGSEILDPFDSVATSITARSGAEELSDFYRGINETHNGDVHLTAMGHSYGSTTTGYAVQEENTGVDDVVTMGSPGVGTPDHSAINVLEGHLYNLESDWDPIADVGWFGSDPSNMRGVNDLSTDEAVTIDGQHLRASTGHDVGGEVGYLAPDTTSQYNASAVVAELPHYAVDTRG